ncbi:hypothetical protein HDU98_009695 [Podochytrium sp. JEL0797]|nr:hypothetical protein HDU98_009695 [Podochytrium sp. JEL0797]
MNSVETLLRAYASAAAFVLEKGAFGIELKAQLDNIASLTQFLAENEPILEKAHITAQRCVDFYKALTFGFEKERTARRLKMEAAQATEQSLTDQMNRRGADLQLCQRQVEVLRPLVEGLDEKRAQAQLLASRIFSLIYDREEERQSKLLDKCIHDFYLKSTELDNLQFALSNLDRAAKLLRNSQDSIPSGEYTNVTEIENTFFALHFVELAKAAWPNARKVAFSSDIDLAPTAFSSRSKRIGYVKTHVREVQEFIAQERLVLGTRTRASYVTLVEVAEKTRVVRYRLLQMRLVEMGIMQLSGAERGFMSLFPMDATLLAEWASLSKVAADEQQVAVAVGQIGSDLGLEEMMEELSADPPSYDFA